MVHRALSLIPPDEVSRDFLVARAVAIARYAMLENSLAQLFAHLLGVQPDVAGVIFFRINNSRARNAAIERLLKKKYGNAYSIFWNSLEKQLRTLDGERNNVVHWATSTTISVDTDPPSTVSLKLIPPNFWDKTESTPEFSIDDLYDFILQCDFISRLVNIFWWRLSGLGDVSAWLVPGFRSASSGLQLLPGLASCSGCWFYGVIGLTSTAVKHRKAKRSGERAFDATHILGKPFVGAGHAREPLDRGHGPLLQVRLLY